MLTHVFVCGRWEGSFIVSFPSLSQLPIKTSKGKNLFQDLGIMENLENLDRIHIHDLRLKLFTATCVGAQRLQIQIAPLDRQLEVFTKKKATSGQNKINL